jgi:hypothetical protein
VTALGLTLTEVPARLTELWGVKHMKSLTKILLGAVLTAGTGSLIYAAPGDDVSVDATITTPAAKQANMSPEEMTASSEELIVNMHGMLRHVTQLHEKASKDKDIIKLNCVNDKLIPLKAQVNLADETRHMIEIAIGNSDDKGRYDAYADLVTDFDKSKDLRDEADACVGDALTYIGQTDVQVTGPNNPIVPGDGVFDPGIEPPTYRTPFD